MKPPNILWLMADQHNANCLGAAGHPDVRAPHLDALAASGVRFERAFCNNPICGPSRACFLTGQQVRHHGVSGNAIRNYAGDAPNIARHFRDAGYQTALIGKAHLPARWVRDGFEHVRFSDLADAAWEDPLSCHYFAHLVANGLGDAYDQGARHEGQPGHGMRSFISEIPEVHCLETWTGDEALAFLETRDASRPFVLKVSFQRPHDPYAPPPEQAHAYDPAVLTLPANANDYFERTFASKPDFQRSYVTAGTGSGYPYRSASEADLKLQMARHFTLITMIDAQIGRIIAQLEQAGERDNTIIAFVADHGDFAGEHGLVLKNFGIYESIHRIPFLIAGPGVPAGETRDALVESVDFAPTLTALAGLGSWPEGDGFSLAPLLADPRHALRDHTVCEWDFYFEPQRRVYAVRDARYRLVHYLDAPEDGELYDHADDPGECRNLWREERAVGEKARLLEILENYRADERRRHTPQDDRRVLRDFEESPTSRLHAGRAKWSEIV